MGVGILYVTASAEALLTDALGSSIEEDIYMRLD